MLRPLALGILVFVGHFPGTSLAQDSAQRPPVSPPPYAGLSEMKNEWNYSCPNGKECSFICPDAGRANHATKLTIYLGTMLLGTDERHPALIYDYATRDIPHGNGFSISTGLGTLSCQVSGMRLDYFGPAKSP